MSFPLQPSSCMRRSMTDLSGFHAILITLTRILDLPQAPLLPALQLFHAE